MNTKYGAENRLGKKTSAVIKKGHRKRFDNIVVYYTEDEGPAITVIVGRKVGKSNIRNRLKRRTRELFRKNKETLKNNSIVYIYKPGAAAYDYETTKNYFEKIMDVITNEDH